MKKWFVAAGMAGIVFILSCGNSITQTGNPTKVVLKVKLITTPYDGQKSIQNGVRTVPINPFSLDSAAFVLNGITLKSLSKLDSISFSKDTPFVAIPDLGGAATAIDSAFVSGGARYETCVLSVASLTEKDAGLYNSYPELRDRSVWIKGIFSNETTFAFDFYSTLSGTQECTLETPLDLTKGASQEVTIILDARAWFFNGAGGYLDPRLSSNLTAIESNIFSSISVEGTSNAAAGGSDF
jgi:hypothetical protein